jgi:DNA-binding CsgD family transcriptional regulator
MQVHTARPESQDRRKRMVELAEFKVTNRDEQILRLLMEGCSNKEIAGELHISPRTVKQHLRGLFQRAGIDCGRKRVKLTSTRCSTPNQAFTAGAEGRSGALLARIEHDSEHNFYMSARRLTITRNREGM